MPHPAALLLCFALPCLASVAVASATAAPLKIMPLGDSITQGGAKSSCYRPYLWTLLREAGHDVDFVGSLALGKEQAELATGPDVPADWDRDHEGRWGWKAAQFLKPEILPRSAAEHRPDVALIHLGTNDLFEKRAPALAAADLESVIAVLRSANPAVAIYVAEIIPTQNPAHTPWLEEYHAACRALAERLNQPASPVRVVDLHTGIQPWLDYVDGAHPNEKGARKMAAAWFRALQDTKSSTAAVPATPAPEPSP